MPDMYLMEYDMELQNTLKSVDMYTESVISLLDKMESMQRNFDTIVKEDADGNGVLTKIKASISKIFTALINTIQKGKIATTSTIQANKLTKLATIVKEFPSVNIKIQDVWSYSKFVDGLIDEHVRKFKRKNTLNLFDKLIVFERAVFYSFNGDALFLRVCADVERVAAVVHVAVNGKVIFAREFLYEKSFVPAFTAACGASYGAKRGCRNERGDKYRS